MTRSQTYAAAIVTAAVAGLVALFFLSGGPEETESLSEDGEPEASVAPEAAEAAEEQDAEDDADD